MRRVAVTGGTGFIGRHLVRRLRRDEVSVAAPSRREANLDDRFTLCRAFEGAEVVFHLAARVTEWGPRSLFRRVNVDGTRNVLEAARAAGVPRVVYVSSDTVYGYPCPHPNTTEETPFTSRILDSYTWSKIEAERLCRREENRVTIARLGWVWGPGDRTILPRLLEFLRSQAFFYAGTGLNVTNLAYVENVADALVLLATHPRAAGEAFNVNDGLRIPLVDYFERLTAALGVRIPPRRRVPYPLVYGAASACELAARALQTSQPPPLTRYAVDALFGELDFSNAKIVSRLGFRPSVGFEEGLARLAGWRFSVP